MRRSPIKQLKDNTVADSYKFFDAVYTQKKDKLDIHRRSLIRKLFQLRSARRDAPNKEVLSADIQRLKEYAESLPYGEQEYIEAAASYHAALKLTSREAIRDHQNELLSEIRTHKERIIGKRAGKIPFTTAKEYKEKIKTHPLVCRKSEIKVHYSNGKAVVSFTTVPIILRPSKNPYYWIDNGDIPYVNVGKMRIYMDTVTGLVYRESIRAHSILRNALIMKSGHPHQFGRYSFCLGDFSAFIGQAIMSGDILLAMDALSTFLHQASNEDGAGKHWVAWVYEYSASGYKEGSYTTRPSRISLAGKQQVLSIRTHADGRIERVWDEVVLENPYINTLAPPPRLFKFWDGSSPLETGMVCMYDNGIFFVHVIDGSIFVSPCHPALPHTYNGANMSFVRNASFISPLSENQMQTTATDFYKKNLYLLKNTPSNFKQALWDLYNDGENTQEDIAYDAEGNSVFTRPGTIRPHGPMSAEQRTPCVVTHPCDFTATPSTPDIYLPDIKMPCAQQGKPLIAGQLLPTGQVYISEDICLRLTSHIFVPNTMKPSLFPTPEEAPSEKAVQVWMQTLLTHARSRVIASKCFFYHVPRMLMWGAPVEPWLEHAIKLAIAHTEEVTVA